EPHVSLPACDEGEALVWADGAWSCETHLGLDCWEEEVVAWIGGRWQCVAIFDGSILTLASLARSEVVDHRIGVGENPNVTTEILDLLAFDPSDLVRRRVARHLATSPSLLAGLAADAVVEVRVGVALNRSAPVEVLEALSQDSSFDRHLVLNEATPSDVLHAIAQRATNENVLVNVAEHRNAGPGTMLLLEGKSDYVRTFLAANLNAPPEVLDRLARAAEATVAANALRNPNTPLTTLLELAEDPRDDRRRAVADNPSLPVAVVEALSSDPSDAVREAVGFRVDLPITLMETLSSDLSEIVRCAVAGNRESAARILQEIAGDPSDMVRICLAQNEAAPASVLQALVTDPANEVREELAGNPSTPPASLELLSEETSLVTLERVASNRNTPPAVLDRLAADDALSELVGANPSAEAATLHRLASHPAERTRNSVGRNPSASRESLALIADRRFGSLPEWTGVAVNPSTPPGLVGRLARHSSAQVRQAAAQSGVLPAGAVVW
ncbi:MAG TPA: hypothetical protein VGD74_00025, partial [Vulgatibacter sp.]